MKRWFLFPTRPNSENNLKLIRFFIKKFGYKPKDLLLFKIALTHKSIANSSDKLQSNERLEYLGDAILDAIIADYLYHKFPEQEEGYLTKVKAKIVNRKSLNSIANLMQVSDFIVYQKGREISPETLEGNVFEAIAGAIYLDSGYEAAKKSIIHNVLRNYVDLQTLLQQEIDFKSQLYIWGQKNRLIIEFKAIKEELIAGKWNYEVEVYINSKPFGRGKGNNKKDAEQSASKETLELMG